MIYSILFGEDRSEQNSETRMIFLFTIWSGGMAVEFVCLFGRFVFGSCLNAGHLWIWDVKSLNFIDPSLLLKRVRLGVHGEDGSIAWTQRDLTAVLFFASKVTQKLWMATLSSIPPRDPSHLSPWFQVPGVIMATTVAPPISVVPPPVLLAKDGTVYWTNGNNDSKTTFRSWDVMAALTAAMETSETTVVPGTLVASLDDWGEIWVAEVTSDNRNFAAFETRKGLMIINVMVLKGNRIGCCCCCGGGGGGGGISLVLVMVRDCKASLDKLLGAFQLEVS